MDPNQNPQLFIDPNMKPERIQEHIRELEAAGWHADAAPLAIEKTYRFPSYTETLNFLIEVGSAIEEFGAAPSITIDGGTRVTVRVGRQPVPALTEDEVGLALALAEAA